MLLRRLVVRLPTSYQLASRRLRHSAGTLTMNSSERATRTTRAAAAAATAAAPPKAASVQTTLADAPVKRARGRPKKNTNESVAAAAEVDGAPAASATRGAIAAAGGGGGGAAAASSSAPSSASASVSASLGYPPSAKGAALLLSVRRALLAGADPSKAEGMRSYMKSALPCYGAYAATCKAAFATAFADVQFDSGAEWASAVATIWDGATHREEKYAAMALARHPSALPYRLDPAVALPLLKSLIASGSWWDYVDDLSSHHLGDLLRAHHDVVAAELLRWSAGDVLWLRRAAITAQLSSKGSQLDWALLLQVIRPAMADETFWLRKAIGWALRQVARERPNEVKQFVRDNYEQLSTLTRKEALKHIGGDKKPAAAAARAPTAAAAAASSPAPPVPSAEDVLDRAAAAASASEAAPASPRPTRGRKRKQEPMAGAMEG